MASLIESVRKLHGPTLVEHDNGYDVDVICPECTRLRTEALDRANCDSEDWRCGVEVAHVPYPCPTRNVAGTTTAEGKDESARMRLEHLVVQREELEERMERLDAVIALIRRDLGEHADESAGDADDSCDGATATSSSAKSKGSNPNTIGDDEPDSAFTDATPEEADGYDF